MPGEPRVSIAKAKGRPMLSWVGKRPLREVRSFPAQLVERFARPDGAAAVGDVDWAGWPDRYERGGLLFHGDNKEVLAHLLANGFRGKVDLVYIDPPFDSGADYVRKVELRGASGAVRMDGEAQTLGEQIQYTDIWSNDNYLQFMYERLVLIRELMRPSASLYLHLDWRRSAVLRLVADEVFGADSMRREIVWDRGSAAGGKAAAQNFIHAHDVLLFYTQGEPTFNKIYEPYGAEYIAERFTNDDADGRGPYRLQGSGDAIRKQYLSESRGRALTDVWRMPDINVMATERTGFPTQKPESVLERLITASSNAGDLVLDCFLGSGTTAAAAQQLGRRWIGADINKGAIQTTEKRLTSIIERQLSAWGREQLTIDEAEAPRPAQLGFSVYRVNDYDLAIQHNEAVNLAIEHLGADRTKTDSFFTGSLGKELLYLVPMNHPCSLLDLEAVARELESRPGEARDVVVVALGRELACEAWLADHNRHRPVGKIRLIELRTDPKYGKFFEHRPASARVRFEANGDSVRISIDDFLSPSIVERLSSQEGVLTPQITDWRSMVDSVFIDAAYDGRVFTVAHADIPERKQDLVEGSYSIARPAGSTAPVAVRITDMFGEEVLVVEPQ